jgi:hypothetical protein
MAAEKLIFMKNAITTAFMTAAVLVAGCGRQNGSPNSSDTPPKAHAHTASSPVAQLSLAAWQQDDKATAVSNFLVADWSARPLFATGSPLSLSEDQFKALSDADRQAESKQVGAQLDMMKKLARAVVQAGHDAASKGDSATARTCFTSFKQCGTALDSPECLQLVRFVGQAFKKLADQEMANIGQLP